jgi:hypothetical protein
MQHVVQDLQKRLAVSTAATFAATVAPAFSSLLSLYPPTHFLPCPLLNASICQPSSSSPHIFTLVIYNPLKRSQTIRVRLPVSMSRVVVKREGGADVLAALMPCWWCEQQHQQLLHIVVDVEGTTSAVMTVTDTEMHRGDVAGSPAASATREKAVATETLTNGIISIELSLNSNSPLFLRNIASNVHPHVLNPKLRR